MATRASIIHVIMFFNCADLWVVEEGVLVVDASTSGPPLPLTMKQTLMPCLLQTQQLCVDLATDAHVCEPLSPVVELHPTPNRND